MIHHNFPPALILAALLRRQEKLYPLGGKSQVPANPATPAAAPPRVLRPS